MRSLGTTFSSFNITVTAASLTHKERSNHMTGDRSIFHEIDDKITGKDKFGDGSTVLIKGKSSR